MSPFHDAGRAGATDDLPLPVGIDHVIANAELPGQQGQGREARRHENHPAFRIFFRSSTARFNVAFAVGHVALSQRVSRIERMRRSMRSSPEIPQFPHKPPCSTCQAPLMVNRLGLALNVGEEGRAIILLQPLPDEGPKDDLKTHRQLERDRRLPRQDPSLVHDVLRENEQDSCFILEHHHLLPAPADS